MSAPWLGGVSGVGVGPWGKGRGLSPQSQHRAGSACSSPAHPAQLSFCPAPLAWPTCLGGAGLTPGVQTMGTERASSPSPA